MLDDNDKTWIHEQLREQLDGVLKHLLAEIGRRQEENNARFDSIDARLKLQAGLLQSGSRAMARFTEFAETSESRWVDLDRRVRAIEQRISPPQQPTL